MKMLCIDGGGIRGVFALAILQKIEEKFACPISDLFDVIAGTSTGAIIAASVALKKQMSEILNEYETNGKKIFVRQTKVGLFKSVYSDRYLRRFFQMVFGELTLKDIEKPLLIPAVNLTYGRPYVHRTNYGHPESDDLSVKLWDAVLSSCSAPVYFPPNKVKNKYLSIDGGLWANNPSLVCVTEAMDFFNHSLRDIKILSLGTGQQTIDFTMDDNMDWGARKWLPFDFPSMKVTPKLLDLALHLSSESVSYHCQHLLGDHYLRLNEQLGKEVPFDEVKYIDELKALGLNVYKQKENEIITFLEK
ncbi:CBASS cGAMP-activated phospholipase [Alkalihalobacterium alkalinitrilicum]|uniref:CBASS cGAMP-activated phospholipase n=1 Tax=Alkalihalobacterium alkalinitrilicum TaxID=427920 RepID=UPI0009950FD3|nr:CBASS cGAMP-activated phospholipase [Alkalihalobacterium alkalinitrilicum]